MECIGTNKLLSRWSILRTLCTVYHVHQKREWTMALNQALENYKKLNLIRRQECCFRRHTLQQRRNSSFPQKSRITSITFGIAHPCYVSTSVDLPSDRAMHQSHCCSHCDQLVAVKKHKNILRNSTVNWKQEACKVISGDRDCLKVLEIMKFIMLKILYRG